MNHLDNCPVLREPGLFSAHMLCKCFREKLTISERIAMMTHDELQLYWILINQAPADMTIGQFRAKHPLPIDEYGVRR